MVLWHHANSARVYVMLNSQCVQHPAYDIRYAVEEFTFLEILATLISKEQVLLMDILLHIGHRARYESSINQARSRYRELSLST